MGTLFAILSARAIVLLMTITLASMTIVVAIAANQPPLDPFAPYTDFLPGQPKEGLLERGFDCQFQRVPNLEEICSLMPQTGIFSEIDVRVSSSPYTGRISQTIFKPRERMLARGDLVLLWGKAETVKFAQTVNLRWPNRHIIAIPQTDHIPLSYWVPITYISFSAPTS